MPTTLSELEETRRVYDWIQAREDAFKAEAEAVAVRVYREMLRVMPDEVRDLVAEVLAQVLGQERYVWPAPKPELHRMTLKELTEYRHLLFEKQYVLRNTEHVLDLLYKSLWGTLYNLCATLPSLSAPSPFTIPLVYALPDPRLIVGYIVASAFREGNSERGILRVLQRQLHVNISRASGRDPDDNASKKPYKYPQTSDLPPMELVDTYLAGTPYHDLFTLSVPLKLTSEERFSHTHIVGGTGAGKTSLIERLLLHDFTSSEKPSLVIIDPHSDLINRLIHADLPKLQERFVLITPRDILNPAAINIFALNQERMEQYDDATREQVSAGVIQTFDYLFSSLFSLDLSGKQQVFFRYVTRLMLSLPHTMGRNATILDMLALMQDATPYLDAIRALPPIQRDFFENDFLKGSTFKQTKEQVRYRLQAIIENPTLARLFTSPETKVDFFTELNRGSIILIDTAEDFLKDGSAIFGRIAISLILQAIQERAAIPEVERKPTFLYIDEAANYFSDNISSILTDARKYKAGLILSHQFLDQATHSLRASLAANTGTKMVSGLSASDARAMASEMRTTPDFILNQPRLQFAAHIRNVTPQAISIPVVPGIFSYLDQQTPEEHEEFLERNRSRVSVPASRATPTAPVSAINPVSPSLQEPDDDISKDW